ncbi:YebC/PmpR family DNA-binding transcriptional regulator [Alkaliphilus sp. B6464]|uniref:YebC/PmpR family DNA-binding transcriptional regulator n=1 Tax=Alkaliphilus sp. B6464 TaxID=2731219 RepID=UPI002011D083|nr:YebC/PmpR family DNA-binding transcriptional regulator [Alkaliphilus sp. B6464]
MKHKPHLKEKENCTFIEAKVAYLAQILTQLQNEEDIKKMNKLIDMLEDNNDVQEVHYNLETNE